VAVVKIGIIGCGYVLDHYMATWARHPHLELAGVTDRDASRASAVSQYYGAYVYPDNAALLADSDIEIVVNLTSIESHYEVTKAALEAGKHVYSEKPLVTDMGQAHELVAIAESKGVWLSCAPSNALSSTSQTMWKIVEDGAIGVPRMVYAEFDDNPIYLMSPEGWRSRSGAPWPYQHEYEMGCTWEHVGYHLAWMCAIFGPVRALTAFSKHTIPDKTDQPLGRADTPDFSVACLDFECGVVGRITCSIAAPYDHRMRIIGNRGMVHADTYRHYECPVRLEPFTKLSMNARKARTVRTNSLIQRLIGVGGRRVPLVRVPPPGAGTSIDPLGARRLWSPRDGWRRLRRSQLGQQDKCIGIAELVAAVSDGRSPFPSHAFSLHLTELTLAIQAAGPDGATQRLTSTFDPVALPTATRTAGPDYRTYTGPGVLDRLSARVLDRLHQH
jgi:predicted dehydrogenase